MHAMYIEHPLFMISKVLHQATHDHVIITVGPPLRDSSDERPLDLRDHILRPFMLYPPMLLYIMYLYLYWKTTWFGRPLLDLL